MEIKIQGARGSFPLYDSLKSKYGTNTSCIEIITDDGIIILDAGTGIINITDELSPDLPIHLVLSHFHMDHLMGLPFFKPLLVKDSKIHIHGPLHKNSSVKEILNNFIGEPYFPLKIEDFPSQLTYYNLFCDNEYMISKNIILKTIQCNHSEITLGYRIESKGKSISYIPDYELGNEENEKKRKLKKFIDSSDLLIFDSTYTDDEYYNQNGKVGWGHSTWQQVVKISKESNIKKLLLFHHAPERLDSELDYIQKEAQLLFSNTFVAREGMRLIL